MPESNDDLVLERDERDALWSELGEDLPEGFAGRVLDAVGLEAGEAALPTAARAHEWRWVVVAVAATALLTIALGSVLAVAPDGTSEMERSLAVVPLSDGRPGEASQQPRASVLADDAQALLASRCSPCHDGASKDAMPGAREVFDLSVRDWPAGMSASQLQATLKVIGGERRIPRVERGRFDAFVRGELDRRR